jgi:hypothetical protein
MATDCVMCGKAFNGAGSSTHIADVLLFPLCCDCHVQSDQDPQSVLIKYPRLFDKSSSMSTSTSMPTFVSDTQRHVIVTDVHIPFGSMVIFMVKWAIASIPALIILAIIGCLAWGLTLAVLSGTLSGILKTIFQ